MPKGKDKPAPKKGQKKQTSKTELKFGAHQILSPTSQQSYEALDTVTTTHSITSEAVSIDNVKSPEFNVKTGKHHGKKHKHGKDVQDKTNVVVQTKKDVFDNHFIWKAKQPTSQNPDITVKTDITMPSYDSDDSDEVHIGDEPSDATEWATKDYLAGFMCAEDVAAEDMSLTESNSCSIMAKNDFLEQFGEIIGIDELEAEDSVEDVQDVEVIEEPVQKEQKDVGSFVNPLTGELSSEDDSEEEAEEIEETMSNSESVSCSDFEIHSIIEEAGDAGTARTGERERERETFSFQAFFEFEEEAKEPIPDPSEAETALRNMNRDIVYELCDMAVDAVENIHERQLMYNKLDKVLMYKDMKVKFEVALYEYHVHEFLIRCMTEYYLERRVFRLINELTGTELQIERDEYEEEITKLDESLLDEQEMKLVAAIDIVNAKEEQELVAQQLSEKEAEFHKLLRETLVSDNNPTSLIEIDKYIGEMSLVRERVSGARTTMLIVQDQLMRVRSQWEESEYVSDTVSMRDILATQVLTSKLEQKYLEKEAYVSRFRNRINSDLHLVMHTTEQNTADQKLKDMIIAENDKLVKDAHSMRKRAVNQNTRERALKNTLSEVRAFCGILEHESLLYKYDRMKYELQVRLHRVALLRAHYKKKASAVDLRLTYNVAQKHRWRYNRFQPRHSTEVEE